MKGYLPVLALFLASVMLGSCSSQRTSDIPLSAGKPAAVPSVPEARAAWEAQWEGAVGLARREGRVFIYGSTAAAPAREAIIKNLRDKFGITVEMIIGRGAELNEKIFSERRAGLYMADVYIGGITTIINELKPAGVLDPLEPAVILPEVKDPGKWFGGKFPFIDADKYSVRMSSYPGSIVAINTGLAGAGELKSFKDLLNPKWKGKMAINDPTISGAGSDFFYFTMRIMGQDYMKELVKQEPVVMRDQRLLAEWLARGRYAVIVAPLPDPVKDMKKAGASVEFITYMAEGGWVQAAGGHLAMMNKAPRPGAARVLINWLLSREGAATWTKALGEASTRLDVSVDHMDPLFTFDPTKKYVENDEKTVTEKRKSMEIAREIFAPLVR